MSHRDVLIRFELMFPQYKDSMTEWFPNGKNSIRVRTKGTYFRDLIFTFNDHLDWRFETVDMFIKSM